MMARIELPTGRTLEHVAQATGLLGVRFPRIATPPLDAFVRRGEIRASGHFLYGPRFPLSPGRYWVLFWLRVAAEISSPRLVFDAVSWDGDRSATLADSASGLPCGPARTV